MNKLLIALLTLSIGAALLAAEGFSTLEEQMTGKEFAASGLDKLTAQELSALNAWIRAHSLATLDPAPAVAAAGTATTEAIGDRRGFKDEDSDDRTTITSRIVGHFSGWDGQTVFKLENGMIWEQADKDKFYVKDVENPVVNIEPGMFGRWHLSIEGSDSECRVKRIQ
jgi:hypothetical protein